MPGRVGFNLLVDLAGECKCDVWWILLDYYEDYQYSTDLRGRVKRHKQAHYLEVVRGKRQILLGNTGQCVGPLKNKK